MNMKLYLSSFAQELKVAVCALALLSVGTVAASAENPVKNGNITPVPDSVFNSLAATPPMGWNSWNKFGCNVSAKLLMKMADVMVSSGMKDAGYQYIVVDDCWQIARDENGNIVADPERFPDGIKAVVDYVHSKGLKFGLYSCAGSLTCAGRPASRGYQFQDALMYAKWGVDYLKYDWCNDEGQNAQAAYKTMSDALKASGRPIVFSLCEWGSNNPWEWGKGIGHLWRTTGDIRAYYNVQLDWGGLGVVNIIDKEAGLYSFAGPGHWNDPDMLEVGDTGLNYDECVSHFSMWCMLAAPLMAGNDLEFMSKETKEVLTNKEVIAVDQDKDGIQGRRFLDFGDQEIWAKPLSNGEIAVCFMNRGENVWNLDYTWTRETIYFAPKINFKTTTYTVRDLWKHQNIGTTKDAVKAAIPAHGVLMVRLSPNK
jgi:alpha-galactosidase